MVKTEKFLLQDYRLWEELNSLQEIAKLELDLGDVGNACSNILIDWPRDIQDDIDDMWVKLKCFLKLILDVELVSLCDVCLDVYIHTLHLFHNWE